MLSKKRAAPHTRPVTSGSSICLLGAPRLRMLLDSERVSRFTHPPDSAGTDSLARDGGAFQKGGDGASE